MRADMAISLLEIIRNGDEDSAKILLQQGNYTSIDHQSSRKDGTPLFWSCCQGFIDLVHLLLLHGADVNKCTAWGASPLHACVDHNRVDILTLLLRFGANVNQQTKNGDTPCHLASYRGFGKCVQRLAERGANITLYNNKHHTPIQEAFTRGHFDVYKYLVAVQALVSRKSSSEPIQPSSCSYTDSRVTCGPSGLRSYTLPTHTNDFTRSPCYEPVQDLTLQTDTSLVTSSTYLDSYSTQNGSGSWSNIQSSDYSLFSNEDKGKCEENKVVGVLRLRRVCESDTEEYNSSTLGNSYLNDLSSTNTSVMSSPEQISKSRMSFKNIQ